MNEITRREFDKLVDKSIKSLWSEEPSNILGQFNARSLYYRTRLTRRLLTIMRFKECPEGWDEDWFWEHLYTYGYVAIINTDEYGVVPVNCSFTGNNLWNRPTFITVSNHLLPSKDYTIHKDCVLIKLQYDYCGIYPLIEMYANDFASCDSGAVVSIMNAKAAFTFEVEDAQQRKTAEKFYQDLTSGNPVVFTRVNSAMSGKSLSGQIANQHDPNKAFIADKLIDCKRAIKYDFLNDIGINNANVDKKERVNVPEVEANTDELKNAVEDWRQHVLEGFKEANEMFGLNLELSMPYYDELEAIANDSRATLEGGGNIGYN